MRLERAGRKVWERADRRADGLGFQAGLPSYGRCDMRPHTAQSMTMFKLCDRPLVTRLDWLARSTRDLLNTLAAIADKGASFRSLSNA
jgi:DNA invertase Pin-like site-specific DNA recombinase